ncbi:homing endonuclease associated repeat-containing protein [Baekduia sp. Peel2402]|uniref:homing endonuclease associated repeat-containing protein n=1 Tax=Baekduia sp. Peel2402 TaxID=3458296 RepID=UPI00403ED0F8
MTDPVDAFLAHWRALDTEERARAFERLADAVAAEQAGQDSHAAKLLHSLDTVTAYVGHVPTSVEFNTAARELRAEGEEVVPIGQLIRHFDTWAGALEAYGLWRDPATMTTPRLIEARFKSRRLGKVWRYTPEALADTMARCVAAIGRPPRIAEYEWWRHEQLERAHAAGDAHAHLPSASPYRRRWKSWNAALLALGYSPEWIAERFDGSLIGQHVEGEPEASSGG